MTTDLPKENNVMTIILWIAQLLLAGSFIWASYVKLFMPADDLAAMWPWTAEHMLLVKITGAIDLIAGIGLILPAWLRIRPDLTIYAAYGVILLMIAASIFHIARGEASLIGINIFFAALAAFIAWGNVRFKTKF